MKSKESFTWLMVDDQEGAYTANIYYHAWYGWISIKAISGEYQYVKDKCEEIVNLLNSHE